MNTASLENCKKLYELSGWVPDRQSTGYHLGGVWVGPKYDLGCLLRKLENPNYDVRIRYSTNSKNYKASLIHWGSEQHADTPEDAACQLAIKLFEEGILKIVKPKPNAVEDHEFRESQGDSK